MGYRNEVFKGQIYEIDGGEFEIIEIRATNVESDNDFIIAVTFHNENETFDTHIQKVIKGEGYKYLRVGYSKVSVVDLFEQCKVLTIGNTYDVIDKKTKHRGKSFEKRFFQLRDDNGKKRWYNEKNSMFKI